MKRFLSIFLIIAVVCSFAIPVNAASPAVSVSSSKTAVNTGDTVTISVKLASGSNLGAIDLNVKFNTSEFQYVSGSAKTGGLFTMENIVDKAGNIRYLGVTDGVVNGVGTLVSIKLKVLKYGGKISVSVSEAIDGSDKDVTSTVSASGITLKCAHGKAEWKVTKKATCTEKGTKKAVCTVCNKEFTEEIKATGHTYGEWIVVNDATETEKGLKKAECTVCGEVKEQIIPVINTETEVLTEPSTEPTTFEEESTEEPSTQASSGNVEEKTSTTKTVLLTILATLGVEAVIAGIIILILKQRKKEKEQ